MFFKNGPTKGPNINPPKVDHGPEIIKHSESIKQNLTTKEAMVCGVCGCEFLASWQHYNLSDYRMLVYVDCPECKSICESARGDDPLFILLLQQDRHR